MPRRAGLNEASPPTIGEGASVQIRTAHGWDEEIADCRPTTPGESPAIPGLRIWLLRTEVTRGPRAEIEFDETFQ